MQAGRCVEDLPGPVRRGDLSTGLLAVPHQHGDLSAEMVFVECEGVLAVAAVVQIRVELHDRLPLCVSGLRAGYLSRLNDHFTLANNVSHA
jgi:hypothetical protein